MAARSNEEAVEPEPEPRARFAGLRRMIREHRILSALLGAYLALSAVELVRILLYDRPREYDAGFYQWERLRIDEGPREFHWTRGDRAYVLRPVWAPVVRIPFYLAHPDLPVAGTTVRLIHEERVFHEQTFLENGWKRIDVWLPAVLGADPWAADPAGMSIEGVAELRPLAGDEPFAEAIWTLEPVPDYIRVFTEWHPPPGPPSEWIEIRVEPTFRPSEHLETDDDRELGIGVGELLWLPELPPEGIGTYGWERDGDREFRWLRSRASQPVAVPEGAGVAELEIRVPGPDVGARPITVRVWWDSETVGELTLSDNDWHALRFAVDGGAREGVLTVASSRIWNPARAGESVDDRDLGAAVTRVRWDR